MSEFSTKMPLYEKLQSWVVVEMFPYAIRESSNNTFPEKNFYLASEKGGEESFPDYRGHRSYPIRGSRAFLWRASNARVAHILWKVVKKDIYVASDMARSARGSARAPIKLSKSDLSIKIDAFSLFDRCHSFKTHRDTESWSLVKNWKLNFWHLIF